MADAEKRCADSVLQKFGLRPMTRCSLVSYYVPAFGVASYTAMSLNVMNPNAIVRILPKTDPTNFLLGSMLLGTGSYLYTREHMKAATTGVRILYSSTGALLFSFGSVLSWAILRSVMPSNPTLCMLVGFGTSLFLLKYSSDYLTFVDSQVSKKK